jgi:hypothetical protein
MQARQRSRPGWPARQPVSEKGLTASVVHDPVNVPRQASPRRVAEALAQSARDRPQSWQKIENVV